MKIAVCVLVVAASALALGGLSAMQAKAPQADAAIKARADTFTAGWNKHDAKVMAACWAADGDLIDPFGQSVKGRAEIEKYFADGFAGDMKDSTNALTNQMVRMLGSDAAVVDYDATLAGMKTPEGSQVPPNKHHVTFVMQRQGSDWLFVAVRPVFYAPKAAPGPAR